MYCTVCSPVCRDSGVSCCLPMCVNSALLIVFYYCTPFHWDGVNHVPTVTDKCFKIYLYTQEL